jgi:hypothetical protein
MNTPLDNDRKNDAILVLALGGTMKMAADFVGCSDRTLYNHARQDREFRKRLRRAKVDIELGCLKTVKKAAHDDQNWRAANQLMKHLNPDRYTRKADTVPVKHAKEVMDAFVDSILSCVEDPATAQKIHKRLRQAKKSVRDRKAAKKSNPQPPRGRTS